MRFLFRLFLTLIFGLPLLLAGALYLAVDSQQVSHRAVEITPASIERAKWILENHDPRSLRTGELRTISVSEADLDLVANYLVHKFLNGSARIALVGNNAQVTAGLPLPKVPAGLYVNVNAILTEAAPLPRFESLRVGRLPVPGFVADWLLTRSIIHLAGENYLQAMARAVRKIDVNQGRLAVTIEWNENLKGSIRRALVSNTDSARLRLYQQRLSEITRTISTQSMALTELLVPLFQLAQERSRAGDPPEENRAAILVLSFYVNGKGLEDIDPAANHWPRAVARTVLLKGRDDFPKHFMVSAALAAKAGGTFSDAVGLYKEKTDSREGSGFSFTDIAANRAGSRFGEIASLDAASARKMQQNIARGISDADIIPPTEDLPEFMPEAEFKRLFGGPETLAYKQIMAVIERRVIALTIFR